VAADPTRRRVLAASALAALAAAGTAGCSPGHPWPWSQPPKPAPDVAVLHAAIAAETAMISRCAAVVAAVPALTAAVSPVLGEHRAHLAQLRARLAVPAGAPSPAVTARAQPAQVPPGQAAAVEYLRDAEHARAVTLAGWLAAATTPSLAQLLASIAASEATHAAVLHSPGRLR
jgi:hypothetical protein